MVIFDLEDSVAPAQKEAARSNLSNHLAEIGIYGKHSLFSDLLIGPSMHN